MICAIPDVVVVWAIRVQVLSLPNTLARTEQLLGTTDGEKKERKEKGKIFQELRFSFFLVLLLLLEQTTKRPVGALSESRNDENYNMYTIADVYGTVKGGPVGDPKGREPIMNGPNGDILNNSNETRRRRRRRKKESTVRIWGASLVRSILLENSRKQPKVRNLEKAQTTFPLSLSLPFSVTFAFASSLRSPFLLSISTFHCRWIIPDTTVLIDSLLGSKKSCISESIERLSLIRSCLIWKVILKRTTLSSLSYIVAFSSGLSISAEYTDRFFIRHSRHYCPSEYKQLPPARFLPDAIQPARSIHPIQENVRTPGPFRVKTSRKGVIVNFDIVRGGRKKKLFHFDSPTHPSWNATTWLQPSNVTIELENNNSGGIRPKRARTAITETPKKKLQKGKIRERKKNVESNYSFNTLWG